MIISPTVWPGPDSEGGALVVVHARQPGLISVPLGFIGCWLGTMLTSEPAAEGKFDELYVRSETGLGAEVATGLTLTGGARQAPHGRGGHDDDDSPLVAPSGTTWPRDYERERDGRDHQGLRRRRSSRSSRSFSTRRSSSRPRNSARRR